MILRRTVLVTAFLSLSPAIRAGSPDVEARPVAAPADDGMTDPVARRQMQVHFLIASELYKDGNYQGAIEEWKRVLKIQPNHALAKEKIQRAREKVASSHSRESGNPE